MKILILTLSLIVSTASFANQKLVGEVSSSSGTSTACCPTGGCSEKLPRCDGSNLDGRSRGKNIEPSQAGRKKSKSTAVDSQ